MLFCSIEFIFFFLPVFLLIYYLVPQSWSNAVLFAGSLFYYWYGEREYFILILLSLVIHYALTLYSAGKSKSVRRICLLIMLIYSFGMLFAFKYMDFFAENWNALGTYLAAHGSDLKLPVIKPPHLILPLGISFYTFQISAYAIDVYRGQVKPEKRFASLGAFLCMFPQLIAGPIVLYHQVARQLTRRKINWRHMENGIKTFIIGLSLKMLLANTFGTLWNQVQTWGVSSVSVALVWAGALAYTFQIYFDFQGYSLMAMGLGEMLGFRIPRNFNHPYTAKSVTDFWRRWHITLSSWFKNYVYIPLGGSRRGMARTIFNMLVVWAFTGLWHGASWNFVLWGLYYFVLLALERLFLLKFLEKHKIIGWAYTFVAVVTGWVIFGLDRFVAMKQYLMRMFCFLDQPDLWFMNLEIRTQIIRQYGPYFILAIIFSAAAPYAFYRKHKRHPLAIIILFILFGLCVYKMYTSASNPFLYFRF